MGSAQTSAAQIEAAIGSQHGVKRNDGSNTVRDHREQLRPAFLDASVALRQRARTPSSKAQIGQL